MGDYSCPEFEYLKDSQWEFTEKVDGTNIRVMWNPETGVVFNGKTDNAQIPATLYHRLNELFTSEKLKAVFPFPVILYGEGCGAKIQKGGGNYKADGTDFVLFDVLIGGIWIERKNVDDIADKLGILKVPIRGRGTLAEAIEMVQKGFPSAWGNFTAEGLVCRPTVELSDRRGNRIVTKIKYRDFL